jgi:hypothetical protein
LVKLTYGTSAVKVSQSVSAAAGMNQAKLTHPKRFHAQYISGVQPVTSR